MKTNQNFEIFNINLKTSLHILPSLPGENIKQKFKFWMRGRNRKSLTIYFLPFQLRLLIKVLPLQNGVMKRLKKLTVFKKEVPEGGNTKLF